MTIPPRMPMPPLAGSLAAVLPQRSRTLLTFPGVEHDWPARLGATLAGKPWLADWTAEMVGRAAAWAAEPAQQRTGWFDRSLAETLTPSCAAETAAQAPFALAGTLLGNLAALRSLQADGLAEALAAANVVATGHSAGILAAGALGGTDEDCARMLCLALTMGVAAARAAAAAGMAAPPTALTAADDLGAPHATPMAAITGPATPQLRELLARLADPAVELAMVNTRTRHVLSGPPAALDAVRQALSAVSAEAAQAHREGRHPGAPLTFEWEPLRATVPFHHSALTPATNDAIAWARAEHVGVTRPCLDPAARRTVTGDRAVEQIIASVLSRPQEWQATLLEAVDADTTVIAVGENPAVAGLTAAAVRGTGATVVPAETRTGRRALLVPGAEQPRTLDYARFLPQHDGDRLITRHTRLTGRSPIILAGMTPTTVDAAIVAAAANAGHVSELAGGGQVTAEILSERIAELGERLEPGHEVVFNALFLDPYLWDLHLGRERRVQRARAAGAPICGVTISAGVPEVEPAVALLRELHQLGIWLNAFKPGSARQVREALAIAAATDQPLWLHVEGGAAGGHHSWEDVEDVLLATYSEIREHDHVVLCAGGGVGTPQRAADLLTGEWSRRHGLPPMPVDAVLVGTAAMATAESTASPQVKRLLADVPGLPDEQGWVRRGEAAGGITSGRSGLNADIHYVANAAARAAALLDEVAGDAEAVHVRRDEIIAALSHTAKPYFGDLADMTYEQMLQRFVELVAVGSGSRYQDGVWLDRSHRARFLDLLQRTEARLHAADSGRILSAFPELHSVDDPAKALAVLVERYPAARTALLHPADVDHFFMLCRRPGKPVPFVPVIDAEVRRWYSADALWQAHDARYDADAVLVIPGPRAVAGITRVDEPVAVLLAAHERQAAARVSELAPANAGPAAGSGSTQPEPDAPTAVGLQAETLTAALQAPTFDWAGRVRPNPLRRLGGNTPWQVTDGLARWQAGAESAELRVRDAATLELTVRWPALAPGDGALSLVIAVTTVARGLRFRVTREALARTGAELLRRMAGPTVAGDELVVVPDDPMAHAALLRSSTPVPDAAMAHRWPEIFALLAEHAPAGVLDLVHATHSIRRQEQVTAPSTQREQAPATSVPLAASTGGTSTGTQRLLADSVVPDERVASNGSGGGRSAIHVAAADDRGYTLAVAGTTAGFTTTDRLHVRQAGTAPALPEGGGTDADIDWIDKPHRPLGVLHQVAPTDSAAFARITGDLNPIHRSDAVARFAGLPGRIVHGMWTSASGQRAVIELACGGDAARLLAWDISFVAPVEPGATLTAAVARTGASRGRTRAEVQITTDERLVATAVATVAPPRTAYVFPGQGIQHQGMGMAGYDRSPAARAVWNRADAHCRRTLGFSILTVVRENPTAIEVRTDQQPPLTYRHPAGVLHLTQFTQVAMATLACAQVAELREAGVFDEDAVAAGHSVGEYNALAAVTGAVSLQAVLELVFARGMAMHHLVPRRGDGSSDYRLGVVRPNLAGLDHAGTDALIGSVAAETGELCEIVNHNVRGRQYAVAGTVAALAELERRLGPGSGGKRAFVLVPGIDVPFHSSALRTGVAEFRTHLERRLPAEIAPVLLEGRYVPNLHPVPFRVTRDYVRGVLGVCDSQPLRRLLDRWETISPAQRARALLIEVLAWQFASPVRWIETTDVLCGELGVERIVEVGVGAQPTLTGILKGAAALPDHRGSRLQVLNVETDADEVLLTDGLQPAQPPTTRSGPADATSAPAHATSAAAHGTSAPEHTTSAPAHGTSAPEHTTSAPEPVEGPGLRGAQPAATAAQPPASTQRPPDRPVDAATALFALVAVRTGVRPDQLGDDTIETLVDGASSRRNQLLMDLGKEFGLTGLDGAHELPLRQLAAELPNRTSSYRFPGPVLSAWLDAELSTTLARVGASRGTVTERVSTHWGLGPGWTEQTTLELALGARTGTSRRSGELTTLAGANAAELVDAAVTAGANRVGVAVAPATTAATATVDAAAVAAATGRIEDLLAGTATDLLARLDRLPAATPAAGADVLLDRVATLDAEHGTDRADAVRPRFDARRHVHLASATAWARADVDHVVQRVAAEGGSAVRANETQTQLEQIALHRDTDPRIAATLRWYAARTAAFGPTAGCVHTVVDRALHEVPRGIAVDLRQALARLDRRQRGIHRLADTARSLTLRPGTFDREVALVTGASPGSIAFEAVRHLLRGGATVVVVTSDDSPDRIAAYGELERSCAGPGAALHVVPANLASFADVDALLEWLLAPETSATRGAALWPTVLLPFAAAPASGSLADAGADHEVGLRLMLLGVQRLVGRLGRRILQAGRTPVRVVLPMSPNHGAFGGDGAYSDAKAALETVVGRWAAEQQAWAAGTRLVAAEIGWVRGTGLMAANDAVADAVADALAIRTFTAAEMGALIAAACEPGLADLTERPWRIDLTGGLSMAADVGDALRAALACRPPQAAVTAPAENGTVPALPNLPWVERDPVPPTFEVSPVLPADEMIVVTGIAELGPWGGSATRWEAELGDLSADAVSDLAWRMGLVTWDAQQACWRAAAATPEAGEGSVGSASGTVRPGIGRGGPSTGSGNDRNGSGTGGTRSAPEGGNSAIEEHELRERLAGTVADRVGVRRLERTPGVAADGVVVLAEVYLEQPLTIAGVTYPAGTAIRVPSRRSLARQVGGQFPMGVDPARHGLAASLARSVDPLAAWNLVVTAEALASAGVTPEELRDAVHPSLIGNVQGTGMGGMSSLRALHLDPVLGGQHANDLLQEALGNVVSAHVNQSLAGGYGPMVHPVAACATAAVSLEEAVDKIRLGKAEMVVAGGWDDLSSEGIDGFAEMAATADNAELIAAGIPPVAHSRPGDRRRRGFVESQGGGSFLVTRGSVARRLGLPVRAVVAYAGSFGDGIQTSIPAPGLGALAAARGGRESPLARALADHGLTADDIAVVSKHDTSTAANDPNEAMIHARIQESLGRTEGAPLRVISQKSLTGHAKGGAAAWQLAGLCDVFATAIVPGNRSLTSVDPDVTPGPLVVDSRNLHRAEPVRAALLTSLGFGHVSAVVALAHPAVFAAALAAEERQEYLRRSGERAVRGQQALLRARHGGPPLFRRRTQRMEREAEMELLLGSGHGPLDP